MRHIKRYNTFLNESVSEPILKFNSNDKLYKGSNEVFMQRDGEDVSVASFGIQEKGTLPLDPMNHCNLDSDISERTTFENSILFYGGFSVNPVFRKNGIGKAIVKKIFNDYPVENIFLYTDDDTMSMFNNPIATPFWVKIGGQVIAGDEDGYQYIQLNRNNIK